MRAWAQQGSALTDQNLVQDAEHRSAILNA